MNTAMSANDVTQGRPRPALQAALVLVILLLLCLGFGVWQNQQARLGGPISTAKVLWLYTALSCFFVVPAVLWRDHALSPPARRLVAVYLGGYVLRALVEMPMLLFTRAWRVEHGIGHNVVMMTLVLALRARLPAGATQDTPLRRFLPLLLGAGLCESLNAALFGIYGKPQEGQYFASDDPLFVWINRITWVEVAVLLPALAAWVWSYHRHRARRS